MYIQTIYITNDKQNHAIYAKTRTYIPIKENKSILF